MRMSKPTKSTEQYKILRMISRDEQFERNGGGQFVSVNRAYRDKSKYNRRDKKKELRIDLNSFLFLRFFNRPTLWDTINTRWKVKRTLLVERTCC